jgi:hypothetical protein
MGIVIWILKNLGAMSERTEAWVCGITPELLCKTGNSFSATIQYSMTAEVLLLIMIIQILITTILLMLATAKLLAEKSANAQPKHGRHTQHHYAPQTTGLILIVRVSRIIL